MIRLVTSRRHSENFAALKSQVVASTRASAGSKPRDLENDRGYRVPRAQAFTVSKASAALVNRRGPKSASIRRRKASRPHRLRIRPLRPVRVRRIRRRRTKIACSSIRADPAKFSNSAGTSSCIVRHFAIVSRRDAQSNIQITTSSALSSMNLRRASTFSPISVVKILRRRRRLRVSPAAACASPRSSWFPTSCSAIHFAQALESRDGEIFFGVFQDVIQARPRAFP